jgi:thymidylate kinase
MIVEFIGCAGAGKTALRNLICEQGIRDHDVVAMPDLVLQRPLLRGVAHPTAVNVVQELGSFPFLLRSLPSERPFLAFARRTLWRHATSRFDKLNGMRGVARKVGMFHLARTRARHAVVLSDEGTLLSSYNLFVATNMDLGQAELDRFAQLVPMPDHVVYVRAPIESLVERARSRPDPRRQHIGRSTAAIEADVRRTVQLFDLLVETAPLAGRVSLVESCDLDREGRVRLANDVAKQLLPRLEGWDRPSAETGLTRDRSIEKKV